VPVEGVEDAVELAAGLNSTCVRHADGTVSCWGTDHYLQLAGESTETCVLEASSSAGYAIGFDEPCATRPTVVPGVVGVVALDANAGSNHFCAVLRDRTASCWGCNLWQQLGLGTGLGQPSMLPGPVFGLSDVVEIRAGSMHTCARLQDGSLWCWGLNDGLECGQRFGSWEVSRPAQVIGAPAGATLLDAGTDESCVVVEQGRVTCWGGESYDEGDPGRLSRTARMRRMGDLASVQALAVGAGHACALDADGVAHCWGSNRNGQLGNGRGGPEEREDAPVRVAGLTAVVGVAAGMVHTCAWTADDAIYCWGANHEGQLGDGTTESHALPAIVPWGAPPP
jgi:alpha-tubulin suppressor-like RCC1 family protein